MISEGKRRLEMGGGNEGREAGEALLSRRRLWLIYRTGLLLCLSCLSLSLSPLWPLTIVNQCERHCEEEGKEAEGRERSCAMPA